MGVIITTQGQASIADAIANQTDLALSRLLVGDGNGNPISPSETAVALVNQVYDIQLASVARDPVNTNWVIATALIPEEAGPFTIREVGIQDANGHLFAVANYPATEKFVAGSGVSTALEVRLILIVSDTADVTITLLPTDYVPGGRRVDTGPGLKGGGDLTENRNIEFDILELPSSSAIADDDQLIIFDTSEQEPRRIARSALVAGLSSGGGGGGGSGFVGGANIGSGAGLVYAGIEGDHLQFRTLKESGAISIGSDGDLVTIGLKDMAAALPSFDHVTQAVVVSSSGNLKDAAPIDGLRLFVDLLSVIGFANVHYGNVAPSDGTKLWWHTSANALKRRDPLAGAWIALTESQFTHWLLKRFATASGAIPNVAWGDTLGIYDVSAEEMRTVTLLAVRDAILDHAGLSESELFFMGCM